MISVTVSPKYQVVIPQRVRKQVGVQPGQKMNVIAYDNQVIFIPIRPVQAGRGALAGIDADFQREEVDEER